MPSEELIRPVKTPLGTLFPNTLWSVVMQAKDHAEPALSRLCETYREPLLGYLCTLGYELQEATDHLQGFFAHLLRKDFLHNVGPEKGKFRTFLICSLKNYLRDQHDRLQTLKRGYGQTIESLDTTSEEGTPLCQPSAPGYPPDIEFDRAWARAVLSNALNRLDVECSQEGKTLLVSALRPVLQMDPEAPSYQQIGQRLEMSEGAVKIAVHRLKGRLGALIRNEIMQTIRDGQDWREEMRYLISLFSR